MFRNVANIIVRFVPLLSVLFAQTAAAESAPGTFHLLTPQECGINATMTGAYPGDLGTGVAFIDYDNDNDLDIYLVMSDGQPNRLYANNGQGFFVDVAAAAFVADGFHGRAVKFADYDNDGDQDIFLANDYAPNRLYRNNGTTFEDVTSQAGLYYDGPTYGAAWGDYNFDGYLDLYICNYGEANILYRNRGDGTFANATNFAGVADWFDEPNQIGKPTFDAIWFDYDNDRRPDLYIANDLYYGNRLYHNLGGGQFEDVSGVEIGGQWTQSGTGYQMGAMGLDVIDYDDDGYFDLYVTNDGADEIPSGYHLNTLFHNNQDGTFTDVAKSMGVASGNLSWGCVFFDYDNDGDEDLYLSNQGPENQNNSRINSFLAFNGTKWVDVTDQLGVGNGDQSFGLAIGDYNNDGFYDMFVVNRDSPSVFYENTPTSNNWIKIRLQGVTANRDAIGARVTVKAGPNDEIKTMSLVKAGSSYLSQNSLDLGFGLGPYTTVKEIRVQWPRPSNVVDVFTNVSANQHIEITEADGWVRVPVFITSFDVSAGDDGIAISWELFADEDIRGFRLHRKDLDSGAERYLEGGRLLDPGTRSLVDTDVSGGTTYEYSLVVVVGNGTELHSQPGRATARRLALLLEQNHPNPFNPSTTIRYGLPEAQFVELTIYDAQGKRVATLVHGVEDQGFHEVRWDGRNADGHGVGTGVYFYRLRAGERILTKKMLLLK